MTVQPRTASAPELLDLPTATHAVLLTVSGRRSFARYAEVLYQAAEQPDIPNRQAVRSALRQVLVLLATSEPAAQLPNEANRIELGERVELTGRDGARQYVVVDPVEAVLGGERVAVTSALGQALLGRRLGEEILLPGTGHPAVVTRVARDG
jgi:transcription elongation GreA/GreB family factor